MLAGFPAAYDRIKAFSETDFTEDLKKFDIPTPILHGADDQIVPIGASTLPSAKIVRGSTASKDQINAELLAFFNAGSADKTISETEPVTVGAR